MIKRVVVIDCQIAGISGGTLPAALIGLGANFNKISKVADSIKNHLEGCKEINLNVKDVTRRGIQAKKVEVDMKESFDKRSGKQLCDRFVLRLIV
ncbi:MAG: nickel insertion protein [Candidatus Baldrarchaeia archaeon]